MYNSILSPIELSPVKQRGGVNVIDLTNNP
jgi:hypothetical protein